MRNEVSQVDVLICETISKSGLIYHVEILSVNGFIDWSANILGYSGPVFYCFYYYYYYHYYYCCCWLVFVFGENLCVVEELEYNWLGSLELGCCCPWYHPPKSTVVENWRP